MQDVSSPAGSQWMLLACTSTAILPSGRVTAMPCSFRGFTKICNAKFLQRSRLKGQPKSIAMQKIRHRLFAAMSVQTFKVGSSWCAHATYLDCKTPSNICARRADEETPDNPGRVNRQSECSPWRLSGWAHQKAAERRQLHCPRACTLNVHVWTS